MTYEEHVLDLGRLGDAHKVAQLLGQYLLFNHEPVDEAHSHKLFNGSFTPETIYFGKDLTQEFTYRIVHRDSGVWAQVKVRKCPTFDDAIPKLRAMLEIWEVLYDPAMYMNIEHGTGDFWDDLHELVQQPDGFEIRRTLLGTGRAETLLKFTARRVNHPVETAIEYGQLVLENRIKFFCEDFACNHLQPLFTTLAVQLIETGFVFHHLSVRAASTAVNRMLLSASRPMESPDETMVVTLELNARLLSDEAMSEILSILAY